MAIKNIHFSPAHRLLLITAKMLLPVVLLVFSITFAFAQQANKARLDSLFNILAEKNKAMGNVVISKNGTVLYTKAIGYTLVTDKDKKPATTNTRYRIGSISKMFTAVIVLQLADEGKIDLNTTLDTYFPQLPNAKKITIANLLNHRSGLHNFTSDPEYTTWMTKPKTQDEMLALIVKNGTDFAPNEKFVYSNTNYVVLGYIIEKICKQPYAKVLTERITAKAGLTNTYYGGKINTANNESYSYKYGKDGWKAEPETDMSIPGGAGAIVSTPADLAKFIDAIFALKLVSQKGLDKMKTMVDGYGMGMYQVPFHQKKGYGHNGAIDGFESVLYHFPDDSLTIAYCGNGQVYAENDIIKGVLNIYFGKNYIIPTFNSIALKSEDLDKYLGVYSSTMVPFKFTVSKNDATLMAQAAGQSAFSLDAMGKDIFNYDPAGIILEFNPDKNEVTLKQSGATILFTMDK